MARKRSHARRNPRTNPRGPIELHSAGYGFVQTAEGEFFIPRSKTRGAFPGDIVEVAPLKHFDKQSYRKGVKGNHKRTARVVAVVERAQDQVIGYFHHAEPFGVVEPADPRIQHDIFTQLKDNPDIPDGAIVRVLINTYPDRNTAATGVVVEVLGDETDERIAIDLIVSRYKLETKFSDASQEQAKAARVDAEEALASGYHDLRERFIFTIDPVDARDFDDAVSLERVQLVDGRFGFRLGVHIADVSTYVPWNSSIDLDARRRATSVYLVDRVIPMLPEELSNNICSLKPNENRRTMTIDLFLTESGEVVSVEPYPALICSQARLTYEQAQALIDSENEGTDRNSKEGIAATMPEEEEQKDSSESVLAQIRDLACFDQLKETVLQLSALAKKCEDRRRKAGGLDFDTVEAKVRLDANGYPVAIDLREKTDATQLIEESMILANEAVARYLRDKKFPCIYRIHEQPSADSLESLLPVLQEFPWFKAINQKRFVAGDPKIIQEVLQEVKDRPEATLVTTLVLRSMKRAIYSPQLEGHYGLASDAYAHFTSPIRRYPDLVVHRMLKAALFGRPEKFDQEVSNLGWIAEHSSEMERVAEKASRESQEVKITEYMEQYIGQVFSALISGVTTFGIFVRLDNTAEGIVEIADLGDEYFVFDAARHCLTGSDTGKEFRLGRRLAVRLVEADARSHQLRFRLV